MKAVVVAGGDAVPDDARVLADADLVVAADGGAAWLDAIGRWPDVLVGDLDSVPPDLAARLAAGGVTVERHPVDKEATDAELAIERAIRAGARRIVVLGALAGARLDHELANVLLLADAELAAALEDLRLVRGPLTLRALRPGRELRPEVGVGGWVSLLPVGGDAIGVRTRGLRFPLSGERLGLGRSRGVSNVVVASPASVSLEDGVLLVMETGMQGVVR